MLWSYSMAENMDPNWMGTGTDEEEIYKENIIDHFKKPHNFGVLDKFSFNRILSKFSIKPDF